MLFFSVDQGHCVVVTLFGKYHKTAYQGLHFKVPFTKLYKVGNWGDVANKDRGKYSLIELTEQITDTRPKECHTKDNVSVTIDASIYWKIIDVKKALFEVDALPASLRDTCLNALRSEIGKLSLDEVLTARQNLSEIIASGLIDVSSSWGITVSRVEIQELKTSDETAEAMRMEMSAERKRRADILEAEGLAEAKKKAAEAESFAIRAKADAEAYAIKAKADAEAEYIEKLSKALGSSDKVEKILMAEKVVEGYRTISDNPSHKVFLPSNVKTLISDEAGEL